MEKGDINQGLECTDPKRWSKNKEYTTGGCSKRATSKWPKAQTLQITPPPHLLSCTNTRLYLHDAFSASNNVILHWGKFVKA